MASVVPVPKTEGESKRNELNDAYNGYDSVSLEFPSSPYSDLAVAVIGMACKFPGADSLEQFWDILQTGTSMCRNLPSDRFPDSRFERRSPSKKFKGNMINDIDAFDHKFFKVTSREAKFMDPQQRLILEIAYQALESAGYFNWDDPETEREMGCYLGTCGTEYHENVVCHPPSAFSLTGSIRPFIAGKLSHYFGWTGPAIMYDAACAAAGTAIHQACRAVASGECSSAVAGATNIFVSPDTFQDLDHGGFTSTTGESKSFDTAADGYCRGEGVALVVLKKLSAALRDGDPIRGIINSTAVNQNANQTSVTIPHGPSQMKLYRKALQCAGLDARDISYVEAHGTGTPVGDPIEVESIRGVFGKHPSQSHHEKTYMGSVKSNIGHTEASSGISGLIKVLLMMQKGVIPQQALFHSLNPAIAPLEPSRIEIPTSNTSWTSKFKAACVNNYGASGTNVVMVVTEAPSPVPKLEDTPITTYPITISAFSPSSLASYCSALLDLIHRSADSNLTNTIAYNLSLRSNRNLPYTVSATVSSISELEELLVSTRDGHPTTLERKQRPVVLFFGGQTGKTASVPQALYESSALFRKHLDHCNTTLQTIGVLNIFPAAFETSPHNDIVLLHSILFSIQYASAMSWLNCGLKPARLIGHSFGQLTALCISGVLSLHDSLRLVTERARLIEQIWGEDHGSMIAVEADLKKVSNLLTQHADLGFEIACYNGPRSFVLAGSTGSIDALEASLKSSPEPMRWTRLQVTHAFHSGLTEPLIRPLQDIAEQLTFRDASIPLELCSKDGIWESMTPRLVVSHTREPVYFHQAVERISEQLGSCTWLAASSGPSVPMLRRALGDHASSHDIKSLDVDPTSPLESLSEVTADLWRLGLGVQFWPFHRSQQHQYKLLNLPPYQFDKSRHWLDWKEPATPAVEVRHTVPEQLSLLQLVKRNEDESEFQINTQCEEWQAGCSEHRILGVSVCPISLLLDLISRVIDTIQHASTGKIGVYNLQQLAMQSPIAAKSENVLSLTVMNADAPRSWSFVVSTASNSNYVYASGKVSADNKVAGGDFARFQRLVNTTHIDNLTNDIEVDSLKGKAVYKSLAGLFQVPRSEQVVKEVSAKGNEASGYLVATFNRPFVAIENIVFIPLLCLNSLHDHQDSEVYINTAVGHAHFEYPIDPSDQNASWAVFLKFFELGGLETTCDIFVFDTRSKQLSIIILDVTFARVQVGSLRQALDGTTGIPGLVTSCHLDNAETLENTETCVLKTPSLDLGSNDNVPPRSTGLPDLTKAVFEILAHIVDLDASALHSKMRVEDLGIDSLMAIEVITEINNFFSIDIDKAAAATAIDVGSLCRLIADYTTDYFYDSEAGSIAQTNIMGTAESSTEALQSVTPDTEVSSDIEKPGMADSSVLHPRSVDEALNAVLRAFDNIREDFDIFAKETGCDKFWSQVYPSQASLVVAYITEAFAKLGCDIASVEAGEKIPNVLNSSRQKRLTTQLLYALRDDGLITQANNDWVRTTKSLSNRPSASEMFERIQANFPQFVPEHKLLHAVGCVLDDCLTDQLNPLTLLFGSAEKRKLMADLYLKAPLLSSVSQQLASFIKQCFGPPQAASTQPALLRVLEIGGGTCGTSLHTVEAFAQLGIPVEYTFSDISASFVAAAKTKLRRYGFVKFLTLDITEEARLDLRDRFDMIIATNVIHATPSACNSARNARQMLQRGGFFTLLECTQNLYLYDVIFGQLDGWWLFDDGRDHAIMDEKAWKTTLRGAGFGRVEWTGGRSRESNTSRIFLAC